MAIILGISGRSQCGKTTAAEYIARQLLLEKGLKLGKEVEILYFGDKLKTILQDLFGLNTHQLYDDEGKKEPTHLKWEDMPGVISTSQAREILGTTEERALHKHFSRAKIMIHDNGYVTGREIMEYFGTNICRRIYEHCWVDCLINHINNSSAQYFIIGDVRSPNEIDKIHKIGGYVARLTRNTENRQTDIECLLDPEVYSWDKFDFILDNSNLDVMLKNKQIYNYLLSLSGPRQEKIEKDFKSDTSETSNNKILPNSKKNTNL